MKQRRNLLVLVIIVLAVLAVYNNTLTGGGSPDQLPKVGFAAPHFTLTGMDDQTYVVKGKREKPVVVNFWASWCGPCRIEMPDMKAVYEKYQDRLDFYAVNLTANDDLASAQAFVKEYGLPFPILLDTQGEVGDLYQIVSIPTTYLIDTDGVIRRKIVGVTDRATLETYVKELIP